MVCLSRSLPNHTAANHLPCLFVIRRLLQTTIHHSLQICWFLSVWMKSCTWFETKLLLRFCVDFPLWTVSLRFLVNSHLGCLTLVMQNIFLVDSINPALHSKDKTVQFSCIDCFNRSCDEMHTFWWALTKVLCSRTMCCSLVMFADLVASSKERFVPLNMTWVNPLSLCLCPTLTWGVVFTRH